MLQSTLLSTAVGEPVPSRHHWRLLPLPRASKEVGEVRGWRAKRLGKGKIGQEGERDG